MPEQQTAAAPQHSDGYENIRRNYGVPVWIGQRIDMNGRAGIVTAPDGVSASVSIQFEGQEGPLRAHPTWETVYYNQDGSIAADYRKQPQEATA